MAGVVAYHNLLDLFARFTIFGFKECWESLDDRLWGYDAVAEQAAEERRQASHGAWENRQIGSSPYNLLQRVVY